MADFDRFFIEISGLCVRMNAKYPFARHHCQDYITQEPGGVIIEAYADDEEIAREQTASEIQHSAAYCESICLYRDIAEQLPLLDRFVFHGAAVSIGGKGFIFTAPSGTGKTTHIDLLLKNYPDDVDIVNGDKPVIRLTDDGAFVCSTPWAGKEGMNKNVSCSLAGIVILKRGRENFIKKISPSDHFAAIMAQTYFPKNAAARVATLELVDKLSRAVDFYLLECNVSDDAAKTSFEKLKT